MATSNITNQTSHNTKSTSGFYEHHDSDVNLRRRLEFSEMDSSNISSTPTKRNSSKHYYQGKSFNESLIVSIL